MEKVIVSKDTLEALLSMLNDEAFEEAVSLIADERDCEALKGIWKKELSFNRWVNKKPHKTTLYEQIRTRQEKLGIRDAHLYKAINMTRSKWNNLAIGLTSSFRDKNIILKIIVILKLDEFSAINLLNLNGYPFPKICDKTDIVIFDSIHKGVYDTEELNEILESNGLEPLFD